MEQRPEDGDEDAQAAKIDWKIVQDDVEKPFVASALEFVPLPVTTSAVNHYFDLVTCLPLCLLECLLRLLFCAQVMHGEGYICLGFLFGRRARVAYLSDVSRFLPKTKHGKKLILVHNSLFR